MVMSRNMTRNERRKIRGIKAMVGLEGKNKTFGLNAEVQWQPAERCRDWYHRAKVARGENHFNSSILYKVKR